MDINSSLKYKKIRNKIRIDLDIYSSVDEKIEYINQLLETLEKLRHNSKSDIRLNNAIKFLKRKLFRLNKAVSKPPRTIEIKKEKVKKNNPENVEELKTKMFTGVPTIINDPIEYIEALSCYILNVDIPLNYNNIMYYIEELTDYFERNNIPTILQRYHIKFFIDSLKKVKSKLPKEDLMKNDVKKVIEYLEEYECDRLTLDDINITYIAPDVLEQSLKKYSSSISKVQRTLKICDNEEFLMILLDYLEQKSSHLDNSFVSNKYIHELIKYISENILESDKEYFEAYKTKLDNINQTILNNKNYVMDKGLLSKIKTCFDDIIFKLEDRKFEMVSYDTSLTLHRTVKFIINDFKDIELLSVLIKKNPSIIDNKIFNETLETYFNTILNSNDFGLIIYYQKVMEVLFTKSILTTNQINELVKEKINSITSRDFFLNREDKEYRKSLLDHTYIILNKSNGFYYNELLETYLKYGEANEPKSEKTIFTLDGKSTKIKENAFSIECYPKKINGVNPSTNKSVKIYDDVYYLTIYTSDISNYFIDKDFKKVFNYFIESLGVNLKKDKKNYSLDEGKLRDTIAFTFKMDSEANILDFEIKKEKIRVTKNFYYETLLEDCKSINTELNNQLVRLYYIGTSIIKKDREQNNKKYDSDFFSDPKNFESVFKTINFYITVYCNGMINEYFKEKGYSLIDRQRLDCYIEDLRNKKLNKQISNLDSILSEIMNKYKAGVIYNASNINFISSKYSTISAPLREIDSLINQSLAYYYYNNNVSKEESNMINFVLDGICDELNVNKRKELTKSKKVVKLNKSEEEDTII